MAHQVALRPGRTGSLTITRAYGSSLTPQGVAAEHEQHTSIDVAVTAGPSSSSRALTSSSFFFKLRSAARCSGMATVTTCGPRAAEYTRTSLAAAQPPGRAATCSCVCFHPGGPGYAVVTAVAATVSAPHAQPPAGLADHSPPVETVPGGFKQALCW